MRHEGAVSLHQIITGHFFDAGFVIPTPKLPYSEFFSFTRVVFKSGDFFIHPRVLHVRIQATEIC